MESDLYDSNCQSFNLLLNLFSNMGIYVDNVLHDDDGLQCNDNSRYTHCSQCNSGDRFYKYKESKEFLAKNHLLSLVLIFFIFSISLFWNSFIQATVRLILGVEELSYIQNLIVAIIFTLLFVGILYYFRVAIIAGN